MLKMEDADPLTVKSANFLYHITCLFFLTTRALAEPASTKPFFFFFARFNLEKLLISIIKLLSDFIAKNVYCLLKHNLA